MDAWTPAEEVANKLRAAFVEWEDTYYGKDAGETLALLLLVQEYAAAIVAAKQESKS